MPLTMPFSRPAAFPSSSPACVRHASKRAASQGKLTLACMLGLLTAAGCSSGGAPAVGTSTPPPQPSFTLSVTPASATLTPGSSTATQVAVTSNPANGFTDKVYVILTGLPSGVTATPATLALSPGVPQTLTLAARAVTTTGSATLVFNAADAAGGTATASATLPVTITAPPAPAPTDLIASAAAGAVSLTWSASSGAASYNIKRYALTPGVFVSTGSPSFAGGLTTIGSSTTATFTDTKATPGTDYLYVVTAVNAAGESAISDHSCSAALPSSESVPPVRPRVFMAAHGTNMVSYSDTTGSHYLQDPTPAQLALVNASHGDLLAAVPAQWAYVATCLDGIWGNYALDFPPNTGPSNLTDQIALFNGVNTRNVINEYDFSSPSLATLRSPTDVNLSGPQTSATGPIVLNREAIEMYAGVPTDWSPFTLQQVSTLYVSNASAPAWSQYRKIYTGFNLNSWTDPSGISPQGGLGVFTDPNSTAAFMSGMGNMQECDLDCSLTVANYKRGFLNNLIATHLKGNPFILFFTVGTVVPNSSPATTGGLSALQTVFRLVNSTPCSGTYYPTAARAPYNLCPDGAATGTGLWRPNDMVLVIDYFGWYTPTPEYATPPGGTTPGVPADSVTGMLNWLLHQ